MKTLVVLACFLVSALAFDLDAEWEQWKAKHGKSYTPSYEKLRKSIFADSLSFIERHNKLYEQGKTTYYVALNAHADLTRNEFNQMMKGITKPSNLVQNELFEFNVSKALPTHVDWRLKHVVTPVKDQKACGSCWAFSTTGSIESQQAIKTGKLVSLSEQNLVDCVKGNHGCFGGWMDTAFAYVEQNGIDTEAGYPYTARDGSCKFSNTTVGARIKGYKDIEKGNEKALTQAVSEIGPVSVAFWADFEGFRYYAGGVLIASKEDCPAGYIDHAVLIVGYGTLDGKDYYLIKNSWGTDWGLQGYVLFGRNFNNQCGIASYASYPVV